MTSGTDQIASWQPHLTASADILLYGCDVASGDGAALIAALAQESGADVAASADTVGATNGAYDWSLEKTTGTIEAATIAPDAYASSLAVSADVTADVYRDDVPLPLTGVTLQRGVTVVDKNVTNDNAPQFAGSSAILGSTVRVYDITDSANKKLLGSTTVSGAIYNVQVGTYATVDSARTDKQTSITDGRRKLLITQQEVGKDESSGATETNSTFWMNIDTVNPDDLSTATKVTVKDGRGTSQSTTGAYTSGMAIDDTSGSLTFTLTAAQVASVGGSSASYSLVAWGTSGQMAVGSGSGSTASISPFSSYASQTTAIDVPLTFRVYLADAAGNVAGGIDLATGRPLTGGYEITMRLVLASAITPTGIVDNVDVTGAAAADVFLAANETNPPSTNDPTPTVRLTGYIAGYTLKITDQVTQFGASSSTTSALTGLTPVQLGDGSWSVQLGTLQTGKHRLVISQQDASGFSSIDQSLTFNIDSSKPEFGFYDATGTVRSTNALVTGGFTDGVTLVGKTTSLKPVGSTITINYTVASDGISPAIIGTGTATVGSDATWSFTIPSAFLGSGIKTISASATDSSGQVYTATPLQNVFVTGVWSPGGIGLTGLDTWFDTSLASNMVVNGTSVSTLYDLSGNFRTATQSSAAKQPTLVTLSNGIKVIQFQAAYNSDNSIDTTNSDALFLATNGAVVSIVYQGDVQASFNGPTALIDSNGIQPLRQLDSVAGARYGFYLNGRLNPNTYGFSLRYNAVSYDLLNNITTNPSLAYNSAASFFTGISSRSGSVLTAAINGIALADTNTTASISDSAGYSLIGGTFTGKIGLVVTYTRALSAAEQQILANAESERFGSSLGTGVVDRYSLSSSVYGSAATATDYSNNIGGILQLAGSTAVSTSSNGGLVVKNASFLTDNASIMFGDNNGGGNFAASTITTGDNPKVTRLDRQWSVDVTGGNTTTGTVEIDFDVASLAASTPGQTYDTFKAGIDGRSNLKLAWRATLNDAWSFIDATSVTTDVLSTGVIAFKNIRVGTGNGMLRDGFITLMDGPTITSVTNADSSGVITKAETTFTIATSERVTGITTSSFNLSVLNGSFSPLPTVKSVTERQLTDGSGNYVWDVVVNVGEGVGKVILDYNYTTPTGVDLAAAGAPASSGGNYMIKTNYDFTQVNIAFDTKPPIPTMTVSDSVLKLANGVGPARETSLITITFDDAPIGFDAADISVDAAYGTLSGFTPSATDSKVFTVTLTAAAGVSAKAVPVTIRSGAGSYQDSLGNVANKNVVQTFDIDTVRPKLLSVSRQTPAAAATNADQVTFRLVFSEAMRSTTVNANDFVVSGTTATIQSLTAVGTDGTTFDALLSGGDLASLNGSVSIALAASPTIEDTAFSGATDTGNSLDTSTAPTSQAYTLDNIAPTVTSVTIADKVLKIGETTLMTIAFSEAIDATTFDATDITVTGGTIGAVTVAADGRSATTTFTPTANTLLATGAATVGVAFKDPAGNDAATGRSASYRVDTQRPTTTSITRNAAAAEATFADTVTFLVTFSEAVRQVDIADFLVTNGGGAVLTTATPTAVSAVSPDANGASATWTITVSGGDLANFNGRVGLAIASAVSITDNAFDSTVANDVGNALLSTQPATSESYLLDNIAPAVTFLAYADDVSPGTGSFGTATKTNDNTPTFSGTVEAGATVAIWNGTTKLGNAAVTGTAWTYTPSALADGSYPNLIARATDAAGNTADATFSIDIKATNSAPVAVDDSTGFQVLTGGTLTIPVASLLSNDTDADIPYGQSLFFNKVVSATNGTAVYDSVSGNILFTPATGFSGTAFFTYNITDNFLRLSNDAKVTINVQGVVLGADAASVTQDQTVSATAATGLLSNDSGAVTVTRVGDGTTFATSVPGTVTTSYGVLTVSADGAYSFVANGAASKALALNATADQVFTYEAANSAGGKATGTLTIRITGVNDAAAIAIDTAVANDRAVTEAGGANNARPGDPSASGKLTVTDVDTGQAVFQTPSSLAGTYGTFTFDQNTGVWSYALNNNLAATQLLKAGQTAFDTLTVTSKDGTATHDIMVTVNGANDDASVSGSALGTVTEKSGVNNAVAGTPTAGGTLTVTDVDAGENAFDPTTSSLSGSYGTFTFNAATGVWGYTINETKADPLKDGDRPTDTLTVKTVDGTVTQVISVTVNGKNDSAVISGTISGAVTEKSGVANGTAGVGPASGTLTATDVDSAATFVVQTNAAKTYGTFTIAANDAWSYALDENNATVQALNVGQTLQEVVTVATADGTTQAVTITISGANDAAVITGTTTGSVTEKGGVQNNIPGVATANGTLAATDVDNPATFTAQTASAKSYGSFTISTAGAWSYTLDDDNAAVQALNNGQTLQEVVTVATADGTTKQITITINGADDASLVTGDKTGSVTEKSGVLNGTPGVATATGALTATGVAGPIAFVAQTNAAKTYGSFTISTAGAWSYTLDDTNAAVQALNAGNTLLESVTVATADGTTQLIAITINGANDAAVITGTTAGAVTEKSGVLNGTAGVATASGALTVTDVDNPATFTAQTASAKTYGSFTISTAGAWSYTLDDTNAAVQALNAGNTLSETVTVAAADGTTQLITITINGANDAAVITGTATGSVTEKSGVLNATAGVATATGTLTATDVDNAATFTAQTSAAKTYGSFTISTAGAWTYTLDDTNAAVQALNAGGTLQDVVTVATADGTTKQITVTINGANDAAVITGTTTGSVTEKSGVLNGTVGVATATGALTATDVDNAATFTAQTSSVKTYGSFTISTAGAWTYTLDDTNATVQALNVGQTLQEVVTVATADGTTQAVTITISGANDAAVITGTTTGSVTEKGGVQNNIPGVATANGTLAATDVDNPATFTAQTASAKSYGSFTISTAGVWSYTLDDNNATVQALNNGQTLQEVVTVATADGTTKQITITINGADDASLVTGDKTGSVTEKSGVLNGTAGVATASGALTATGVAGPVAFVAQTNAAKTYGSFTISTAGAWSYTLDDNNTSVQALNAGGTLQDAVTVATADGTTQLITITINGANDAAVITGTTAGSVTEKSGVANATAGVATASGALTVTDVDNPATFVAQASAAKTYGAFTISTAGAWTYTLDDTNAAVQALNAGATLQDVVTVAAADGTTQLITITINGANDAAVIAGTASGSVTEKSGVLNGTPGVATASGALTVTDVDNPATFVAQASAAKAYGSFTISTAGAWTYTLDDTNAAVQALNAGASLQDVVTVAAADGTTKQITITINGANDAAVITGTKTGAVTEKSGVLNGTAGVDTAAGALTATDVDSTATFVTQTNAVKTYGSFTIDSAGAWSYTLDDANTAVQALNVGATLQENVTVATTDGTTQLITITINGANDAATISGTTTGSVTEKSGVLNGTAGVDTASGTLAATDVDSPAVFVAQNAAKTYGAFTINAAGAWSYTLDDSNAAVQALNFGAKLQEVVTVATADGTTQQITITINGANDAAVITGVATGSVTEKSGVLNGTAGVATATGALTATDVDSAATFTAQTNAVKTYGSFTINAAGAWSYTLDDNNAAVQALNVGASLQENVTVETADGTTKQITVTITGANDAPVIDTAGSVVASALTETNAALSASGRIVASDVDSPALTASLGAQTVSATGVSLTAAQEASLKGGLKVQADGTWTYAIPSPDYLPAGAIATISTSVIVTDGGGATASQLVTITITGVNDAPVAAPAASLTGDEDTALSGAMVATDVDGDTLSYVVKPGSGPAHGVVSLIAATGRYTYTPDANYNGADAFTLVASDGKGGSVEQKISITLRPVNDAPVGQVKIDGTIQIGQTLTASNTITDIDGVGPITYIWLRDGVQIAGATGATYVVDGLDAEHGISVRAIYVDGGGTREQVTSAEVSIPKAFVPAADQVARATAAPVLPVVKETPHLKIIDVVQGSGAIEWGNDSLQISNASSSGGTLATSELVVTAGLGAISQSTYSAFMFVTVDHGALIELRLLAQGREAGSVYTRLTESQYDVTNESSTVDKIGGSVFVLRSSEKASVVLEIKQDNGRTVRIPITVDTVTGTVELNNSGSELADPRSRFADLLGEEVDPGMRALMASLASLKAPANAARR